MSRAAAKAKPKPKSQVKTPKAKPSDRGETPFIYRVVNAKEAAEFLKVTEKVVIDEAEAGNLPGKLLGGEWRFALGGILQWLSPNVRINFSRIENEQFAHEQQAESVPFNNRGFLNSIGAFTDDESLESMIDEIYQARKRQTVGA